MNLILGARLTAIFDSDHSGTALDLPYVYSTRGIVKEPDIIKAVFDSIVEFFGGSNSEIEMNHRKDVKSQKLMIEKNRIEKSSDADVIMLSG